ncbi:hypothetical protein P3X46_033468 [Hevea brasiliensis]|uniref:leucine--tRNA ligase n=1 Tax=Hevea brasiliensis TaxID=3981 RepID=A0ABQ9KJP7_HEVBR|nr:hypothetical protein P3X46_033468 [Hevea brasiliensis]
MLKITAYADCLLEDLVALDWPESVKEMQRNWIGRSEGADMDFHVLDEDGNSGTGAIMAVPAHDTCDYDFATKYHIPIRWVVKLDDEGSHNSGMAYAGQSTILNSSNSTLGLDVNGFPSKVAASKVTEWAEKTGNGKKKVFSTLNLLLQGEVGRILLCLNAFGLMQVNYKLRDWLFARQCYWEWGESIPVVFLEDTGESVKTTYLSSGKPSRRGTSTVPQWTGSCWYRSPVDVYVDGAEHAVLHLLYSRFWHKVLYDIGVLSAKEPFKCVINQGIILGEVQYIACKDPDGNYMSADSANMLGEHQEIIPEEKVTEEIEGTRFNTGISAMMEFIHTACHSNSFAYEPFPEDTSIVLPVQINGKTQGTIQVEERCSEEDAFRFTSRDEKLSKYLDGKSIKKRIFVPGKV